ncbi:MAG: YihA family ribosome biogenesis GTP-binding protein [Desulfobacteraceae bacterium]|jgi:GTP-binding protein|nr:MAG: YihA family ribosome biogenesis GTP-binding protein [Desulfobacteraceae bacterium]
MDARFLGSAVDENQYPASLSPEIAFAGRSNVGKSSLINTLLNRKNLAKTSSQPGRTRLINFFAISAYMVLVDLPGYGFARVPLQMKKSWRVMVERYLSRRANLKAVVVILDIRRDVTKPDMDLIKWLRHYKVPEIVVLTKADKLSRGQAAIRQAEIIRQMSALGEFKDPVIFSSKTRQGRDELWKRIRELSGELPNT